MSRRGRRLEPDEAALFLESQREAKPLAKKSRRVSETPSLPVQPETPPPPARPARRPPPPAVGSLVKGPPPPAPLVEHGAAPGVDKRTHDRFRRGEMVIDGKLDLHGLTQDMAHRVLIRFVTNKAESGARCLLVVTGKGSRNRKDGGGGVLYAQVPRWLNEAGLRPLLLSIQRAQPQHGGDGALYLLLKRKR